jgi:CHASE2 domain-containing sensor protein
MAPMPIELPAGVALDGTYLLQGTIGGGRFGVVYRAVHIGLQKAVAVKVLDAGDRLSAGDFEQFRVEAEALGRLSHPHIVGVTDFGVDPRGGGTPYLVMELVDGPTLEQVASREGPIDLERAAPWLAQVASALDHAHASGVVHGDLSANNVVLVGDGTSSVAKVIDFGLARLAHHDAAHEPHSDGSPLELRATGTPGYSAPEQWRGELPSVAADVYALAALAYRLVAGRKPFSGDAQEVRSAQLTGDAPAIRTVLPTLPRALDVVIARSLSRRISDRPTSAGALARALTWVAEDLARARWRRREAPRRIAMAASLAVLVAMAGPSLARWTLVQRLEGTTMDVRFALSRPMAPDPRLLLVSIDDESLSRDARPLAMQADAFAHAIRGVLDRGATAVALDLLLPATWAESRAFGDLVLAHADRLVLGVAVDGNAVVGPEAIDPLVAGALGPERASTLFGLVTQEASVDGVIRTVRGGMVDRAGQVRSTLAGRVVQIAGGAGADPDTDVLVNYAVDATRLERIEWQPFVERIDSGDSFKGRLVLVGAEFTGSGDRHRVPGPGRLRYEVSGLTLQGLATNTLIGAPALTGVTSLVAWTAAAVTAFLAAWAVLWTPGSGLALGLVAAVMAVGLVASAASFTVGRVAPVAGPLLSCVAAVAVAWVVRSRLPAPPGRRG